MNLNTARKRLTGRIILAGIGLSITVVLVAGTTRTRAGNTGVLPQNMPPPRSLADTTQAHAGDKIWHMTPWHVVLPLPVQPYQTVTLAPDTPPPPPSPSMQASKEAAQAAGIVHLIGEAGPGYSMLLTRCVRAVKRSQHEYDNFRRMSPNSNPDYELGVLSGHLQILETLSGPPMRGTVDVDNTDPEMAKRGVLPMAANSSLPILTQGMRLGEYWIVYYNHNKHEVDNKHGCLALTGLDDPVLTAYRRFHELNSLPDQEEATRQTIGVLRTPQETLQAQMYALNAFLMRRYAVRFSATPESQVASKAYNHTLNDLITAPDTLQIVRHSLWENIWIDMAKPIPPDSQEAFQLHYLLHTVRQGTEREAGEAAEKLVRIIIQSDPTMHTFDPEIMQALRYRDAADQAATDGGGSFISRCLSNLKLVGYPQEATPALHIRHLPSITNHLFASRLQE